ncbi:methyltransferase [Mycolicibacterium sp. Dal123E01]|uniref:methyltransferase n=1 Tax=Mycolicibacterium sp. Dal123E01 TaxID=3457578 RepID=UPI00403E56BE
MEAFKRSVGSDSTQEIFEAVYEKRMWGVGPVDARYSSGSGSHDSDVVGPYVAAVSSLIESLESPPDAVDLGCGDFAIGSRLRPLFNRYTACDVVPGVLEQNRVQYRALDVDFRLVDIAKDELPAGDIVFVRQVLQHLSNEKISRALGAIKDTYAQLVLTEHLPLDPNFVPNIDIATGPDVRLTVHSGVDISKPPFSISATSSEVLCEVEEMGCRIRTTLYTF